MATSVIPNPNFIETVYASKPSGSKWTSGTISLRKCNGIVLLKLDGAVLSQITSRETIATVPDAYKPVTESYFRSSDGNRGYLLKTNGDLQAEAQSAGSVWGTGTYISG